MSSEDRLKRLGLSHLADKPQELGEALMQKLAKLDADHELAKAMARVQDEQKRHTRRSGDNKTR